MPFELPEDLLEESFLAATGPGGQNVNKVATACQLRVNIFGLGLPPFAFRKLKMLAGSKMTAACELIVTARNHRTRLGDQHFVRCKLHLEHREHRLVFDLVLLGLLVYSGGDNGTDVFAYVLSIVGIVVLVRWRRSERQTTIAN